MPFDSALDNTEKVYLRGDSSTSPDYEARPYLSVCPNTVIYTARINNSEFLYPLAQLPIDGGSGTVGDIEIGMTVLISHTNDASAAFFRGRVRVAPVIAAGAGQLYINETGDLGFADNDYIFILDDFAVMEKLPRDSGGYPVPDWNQSFRQLLPMIYNLRSAYADWISGSTLTLSFAPTVAAATSGASISTYSWDVADGTITVGSSSTKDITATFPAGFRWVKFTATDSGGRTATRRFPVWAHSAAFLPVILSFSDLRTDQEIPTNILEGTAGGYDATVQAVDDVDGILDNTLVVAWVDQYFNGTAADIGSSGNIRFVGRFRAETNDTGYEGGQRNAIGAFEFEGVLSQLSRLRFPPVRISSVASPTQFNEVKDLTIWRAIHLVLSEYSTFLELHSLKFDSTSDDFLYPELNTQGGDLLNTVADLAQSIDAVLQDNQAGMCEVVRRLAMLPSADRSGITSNHDFTTADFGGPDAVSLSLTHIKLIGLVKGDGGGYNETTGVVSAYRVRAPNGAPLGAALDGQIPRQVLIANQTQADEKAELEERAGHALAAQWAVVAITLHLPDSYDFLTPDAKVRYTITLPATETVRGRAYTTSVYWWLQAKRSGFNPQTGRVETHATFIQETSGTPGRIDPQTVLNIPPEGGSDLVGYFPPPEVEIDDGSLDVTDGTIDVGSICGSDVCSDCSDGQSRVDEWFDTGANRTFQTITVTYDADATQTGFHSLVQIRQDGEFFHTVGSPFNVTAGTGVTQEVVIGGQVGRYIRVLLVGDTDACIDTVTLTALDFSETADRPLDSFTVQANDSGGTDSNISLLLGQRYRMRVSGVVALGAANADFDMLWHLNTSTYNGPFLHVDAVPLEEEAVLNTAYNPIHIYEFVYTGTGSLVNILVGDSPFAYGDNSGEFLVEVFRYG